MVPNNFPGPLPPNGILGPNMPVNPFGQGSFEPLLSGPEFNDLVVLHKLPDTAPNAPLGGPNWRRPSPGPGMLPSPLPGMKTPIRPVSGAWDVFDANQIQRDSKRSRIDAPLPVYDSSFPLKKKDDRGLGLEQLYGRPPQVDGGASGPLATVQGKNHLSPEDERFTAGVTVQGHLDHDFIWRGVIAKGGTPVCHARCVAIGKGLESDIPEVVNCSARTGLELLTKHYAEAVGFDIVVFLPDSEDDFASYTEFLRYLGAKNRAGVAKFDDGTTLFLVPPSDFLTKVLNVTGPERLYGVVLKFPHARSSTSSQSQLQSQSLSLQCQYVDRHQIPSSQTEFSVMSQKEEKVLQMDYNRVLHEDTLTLQKQRVLPTSDSLPVQPVTTINTAAVSQAGVTLTPELIATLASLIPAKGMSSGLESARPPLGSSSLRPSLPPNTVPDKVILPQGYDHQAPEQTGHSLQQLGNQFNPQAQLIPQLQTNSTVSNAPSNSAQWVTGSSQGGQFAVSPQVNQQNQYVVPQNTQKSYGMAHGRDAFGSYGSSVYQQPTNPVTMSNQVHSANVSQPDTSMPLATEKVVSELPNQVQQLQSALHGADTAAAANEHSNRAKAWESLMSFPSTWLVGLLDVWYAIAVKIGF
ncbi:hypothetical protein F0562_006220 [Nyssa sinensis]|uniref:Spen paralogue and orthologue SPOC C-terminal domain-containing protein n=1 Tax=Nyssa sinensis TaxID=561372 RepID=A0A5J5APU5_9ASTE|nr:hypothetical protein F0562_006220 [Nyssa sinensis]